MASDVLEIMGKVTETDNRNTISISAENREEADKLFNGLSEGGKLKCQLPMVHLVLTLECLQTNLCSMDGGFYH
jgi:hypothetical protein